ncbi:MAG: hypothetical protein Kow0010_01140 [Dehalococcoidia bacterium]
MRRDAHWLSLCGAWRVAPGLGVAVALVWVALTACGGSERTPADDSGTAAATSERSPWPRQSLPTVDIGADGRVEGDKLLIRGFANVPDGALIAVQVTEAPSGAILVSTTTEAAGGTFTLTVDIAGRGPRFDVWVAFQDYLVNVRQPEHVRAIYGDRFEYLDGENVYRTRDRTGVAVQFTVARPQNGR